MTIQSNPLKGLWVHLSFDLLLHHCIFGEATITTDPRAMWISQLPLSWMMEPIPMQRCFQHGGQCSMTFKLLGFRSWSTIIWTYFVFWKIYFLWKDRVFGFRSGSLTEAKWDRFDNDAFVETLASELPKEATEPVSARVRDSYNLDEKLLSWFRIKRWYGIYIIWKHAES